MSHEELISRLSALVSEAGTQKVLAQKLGISAPYLSDILMGKREPGGKVLRQLGLERVISYREVGPSSQKRGR